MRLRLVVDITVIMSRLFKAIKGDFNLRGAVSLSAGRPLFVGCLEPSRCSTQSVFASIFRGHPTQVVTQCWLAII